MVKDSGSLWIPALPSATRVKCRTLSAWLALCCLSGEGWACQNEHRNELYVKAADGEECCLWSEAPLRVVGLQTAFVRMDACRCSEGGRGWGSSKNKKASLVYWFPALMQGLNWATCAGESDTDSRKPAEVVTPLLMTGACTVSAAARCWEQLTLRQDGTSFISVFFKNGNCELDLHLFVVKLLSVLAQCCVT